MGEHSAMATPAPERFVGAEAWVKLPSAVKDEIGAMVLELIAAHHLGLRVYQDDLSDTFERIANAADTELTRDLYAVVIDALPRDAFEASDGRTPRIPSLLGGVCRVCGCSQNDACAEGCGWAAEDLCTACVAPGKVHDHG